MYTADLTNYMYMQQLTSKYVDQIKQVFIALIFMTQQGSTNLVSGTTVEFLVYEKDEQIHIDLGLPKHFHDGNSLVLQL